MSELHRQIDPPPRAASTLCAWLVGEIAALSPGCFALVMATGIVSNAFFLEGRRDVSDALLAVNLVAYPWLIGATILRAVRFARALWADLLDPRTVFSFFTIVAATDVLGMAIDLRGFAAAATALWFCALAVWLVLTYLGFGVLTFRNAAPSADVGTAAG